jgi:AmiR/NasT family two-component response regulator
VTTRNIDNDEAYNFIRRQAMDRRISVTNVATAIVASHDLLSPRDSGAH